MFITVERRDRTVVCIRKRRKTCVWGRSQRDRDRGSILSAANQLILAPGAFLALEREMFENNSRGKLENNETGEKQQKKLELAI